VLIWCAVAHLLPSADPGKPRRWGLAPAQPALTLANYAVFCGALAVLAGALLRPVPVVVAPLPMGVDHVRANLAMFAAENARYPTFNELSQMLPPAEQAQVIEARRAGLTTADEILAGKAPTSVHKLLGVARAPMNGRYGPNTPGSIVYDRATQRPDFYILYDVGTDGRNPARAVVADWWQGASVPQQHPKKARAAGTIE
jgi:hypothetical protein